jgi:hypothetical protein
MGCKLLEPLFGFRPFVVFVFHASTIRKVRTHMLEEKGQHNTPTNQKDIDEPLSWTGILPSDTKQPRKSYEKGDEGNKGKDEEQGTKQSWHTKPEKIGWDRIIELILAGAIAGATCVQLYTVIDNNRTTGKQAERLLDTANRMDDAADSFSKSSADISRGVSDAVGKLNLQAGELTKSVQQASRLADEAEIANQNVVNSDRPWMGGILTVSNFDVGGKPLYSYVFINSGRRPARVTLIATKAKLYPVFPSAPDKEYSHDADPSTSVIVPGQSAVFTHLDEGEVSQHDMDVLKEGSFTVFSFAKVEYVDLRTDTHYWTHACIRFIPKMKIGNDSGWRNCNEYNDAK